MSQDKTFLRKLISVFETNDLVIEHMPSSVDSISVLVATSQISSKLSKLKNEIMIYCNPDNISHYDNMALLAVVGRGMIETKGISAKVFTSLAQAGVNIKMISQGSSELNIIVGIENKDFENGVKAIYDAFE